ncbi:MAG: hypothetical protein ACRCW4_00480 [Candidatus Neomicrothrix subdominans]
MTRLTIRQDDPELVAARARRKVLERHRSAAGERCVGCGQTLVLCPGTLRVFVRCCPECTHLTTVDLDYFELHPTEATELFGHRLAKTIG